MVKTNYEALILTNPTLSQLRSETYQRFLCSFGIETGVRLLLHRHARSVDWPYPDTKFNPNTGLDLSAESYQVVYPWLLGRGMESLLLHLDVLDSLHLTHDEKSRCREIFPQLVTNMAEAILTLMSRYKGRCPFRVDRSFALNPLNGNLKAPDLNRVGEGDLFCAKGLSTSATPAFRDVGVDMLDRIGRGVDRGLFELEAARVSGQGQSQSMHMLFQSVPRLLARGGVNEDIRERLCKRSCQFMEFVLAHHWDPGTGRFSEYIDPQTLKGGEYLDPGHATEFVGLGLSAVAVMETQGFGLDSARQGILLRAKGEMPRLLIRVFRAGFNERWEGIFKAVNNRTGEVMDFDMPWWNLPETMRAALLAALATTENGIREECLAIYAKCHNAYFRHYLNPDMMYFPYQTRCGRTGKVLDSVPAIPEGDPLYHSNLSFLEILSILRQTLRKHKTKQKKDEAQ
jgi:hypothetical protein